MNAPWDDEPRIATRERETWNVDLEPTAIVHRSQQQVQRPEMDIASMCQIAQQLGPRDRRAMESAARELGTMLGGQLKKDGSCHAYYSWEQGGGLIEGPTVDLVESVAEVWGRTIKSVEVVHHTDTEVELVGAVCDLLTLVVTRRPFHSHLAPPPGRFREKADQAQRWRAAQLQSAVSKAIRGALEHALPPWLLKVGVDAGKVAHAKAVLGGQEMGAVVDKATGHLAQKHGLAEQELVAWLGSPKDRWTIEDVARLRGLAEDLKDGRTTPAAVRAAAIASPSTEQSAPDGDRLSGLGLGEPQTTAPPSPTPAAPSPTPAAEPAGVTAGAAPAGGGGQDRGPDPEQAQRDKYVAEIAELEKRVTGPVKGRLRGEHGLQRIFPKSADLGKLSRLAAALREGVARLEAAAGPAPEPEDEWDGPTGQDLVDECGELLRSLDPDAGAACLDQAGIPQIDGASEEALRRLLVALMDAIPAEVG